MKDVIYVRETDPYLPHYTVRTEEPETDGLGMWTEYYSDAYVKKEIKDAISKSVGGMYKIDDEVYFMRNNKVWWGNIFGTIVDVDKYGTRIVYKVQFLDVETGKRSNYKIEEIPDYKLFKSKEELINSL